MRHVLYRPAADDPHGILADGPLNSAPPRVRRKPLGDWTDKGPTLLGSDRVLALPLVWDGVVIPEGEDRALRMLKRLCGAPENATVTVYNVGCASAHVTVEWDVEEAGDEGWDHVRTWSARCDLPEGPFSRQRGIAAALAIRAEGGKVEVVGD